MALMQKIHFLNDSGETIPAFGVVQIDSASRATNKRLVHNVQKGASAVTSIVAVNGAQPVTDGRSGTAYVGRFAWVAYEGGTPSDGDEWGPDDSWKLRSSGSGFRVLEVYSAEGRAWCYVADPATLSGDGGAGGAGLTECGCGSAISQRLNAASECSVVPAGYSSTMWAYFSVPELFLAGLAGAEGRVVLRRDNSNPCSLVSWDVDANEALEFDLTCTDADGTTTVTETYRWVLTMVDGGTIDGNQKQPKAALVLERTDGGPAGCDYALFASCEHFFPTSGGLFRVETSNCVQWFGCFCVSASASGAAAAGGDPGVCGGCEEPVESWVAVLDGDITDGGLTPSSGCLTMAQALEGLCTPTTFVSGQTVMSAGSAISLRGGSCAWSSYQDGPQTSCDMGGGCSVTAFSTWRLSYVSGNLEFSYRNDANLAITVEVFWSKAVTAEEFCSGDEFVLDIVDGTSTYGKTCLGVSEDTCLFPSTVTVYKNASTIDTDGDGVPEYHPCSGDAADDCGTCEWIWVVGEACGGYIATCVAVVGGSYVWSSPTGAECGDDSSCGTCDSYSVGDTCAIPSSTFSGWKLYSSDCGGDCVCLPPGTDGTEGEIRSGTCVKQA